MHVVVHPVQRDVSRRHGGFEAEKIQYYLTCTDWHNLRNDEIVCLDEALQRKSKLPVENFAQFELRLK